MAPTVSLEVAGDKVQVFGPAADEGFGPMLVQFEDQPPKDTPGWAGAVRVIGDPTG
jgi:hypothetical protein